MSAPNHASIATGVSPSKHGVTANGKTASGNYAAYPTWLKRVVDAKSGTSALFVYSWSEDADLGPAAGVTFLGKTDAENATDLAAMLASSDAPDAQRLQRRERRGERLHDHGLDGGHDEPRHP